MDTEPSHESHLYHKRCMLVVGLVCVILGLLILVSLSEKLLAICFEACGVLTIIYTIIAKDSFEKVATSSEPTSSDTEEY